MTTFNEPHFVHLKTLQGHTSAVASLKFAPGNGGLILSGSGDRTAKIWKVDSGDTVATLKGHEGGLNDVCWIGKGRQICTASDDMTIGLWDVETETLLNRLIGHGNFVFSIKSNARGDMIISGSFDETVRMWDVRTSSSVREIPAHADPVTSVDLSPDESSVVSSSFDGHCRVWLLKNGQAVKTIPSADCAPITNVQFVPNGRFLLMTTLDGTIIIRDYITEGSRNKEVLKTFVGHLNDKYALIPALTAVESGNSKRAWVVCGSEDNAIYIWQTKKSKTDSMDIALGDNSSEHIKGRNSADEEGFGHCDVPLCAHAHPQMPIVATGANRNDCTIKIWKDASEQ